MTPTARAALILELLEAAENAESYGRAPGGLVVNYSNTADLLRRAAAALGK